jgi:hypothetical protein
LSIENLSPNLAKAPHRAVAKAVVARRRPSASPPETVSKQMPAGRQERFSAAYQLSEGDFSTLSWGGSFTGAFSGFFLSPSFPAPTRVFASSLAFSFLFSLLRFLLLASSRSFSRLGMLSSFQKIKNPKSEYRNPNIEIRKKFKMIRCSEFSKLKILYFGNSSLFRISDFVIRIYN